MKLVGAGAEGYRCHETRTSFRFEHLTVLIGRNDAGKSPVLDALAMFFDEKAVRRAMNPVFVANGNRNVPPKRDVEPAILSLAELRASIQLAWRAMQPHSRPIGPTRSTHVK
jgi:predicted ATPase